MTLRAHRALLAGALGALALGCGETRAAAAPAAQPATGPIHLVVDARDAATGRIKSHLTIPIATRGARATGELALVYPKWIPGEHAPSGPAADLTSLVVSAGGHPVAWRRNPADVYEIDVALPKGASSVDVSFESIRTASADFGGSAAASPRFVDVVWNQALLYPKGARSSAVLVDASVKLPKGWSFATALPSPAADRDGAIGFGRVTLETLVDSPLVAGKYVKTYDLGLQRGAPHALTIVGEDPESLVAPKELVDSWKRLVVEANALFGARHYDSYTFLLLASDSVPDFGLEHHQSSEDYVKERTLTDPGLRRVFAELLPHEYVHSWNGKYRRPKGLATPSYQEPMRGELLWVYEGLTEYLGWVLATRSGMQSLDDAKAALARAVDHVDVPGRRWRPLVDTASAAQLLYEASRAGSSSRRGVDFYPEGLLVWLEADVIIRRKTGGAHSLDDFCERFHGGTDSPPEVRPYDLADVIRALDDVAAYDWKRFFDERVYQVAPKVPTGGIEGAGYRLVMTDKKPETLALREKAFKVTSLWDGMGFVMDEDDVVTSVLDGSAAAKAGLTEHMKILAADSRKLSPEVLGEALARAKTSKDPIELLVEKDGWFRTLKVDYHDGERYRTIERDPSKPDVLASIVAPRASSSKK
jgi:predicted metalloprotease with PDZ domain